MSTESSRPRTALALSEIVGGLMVIIGLIVGFTDRTTSQYGGAKCGSVLGGGGEGLTTTGVTVCDRALSTPTTWTWLLLIVGILVLIAGWIIDTIQKNSHASSHPGVAPA